MDSATKAFEKMLVEHENGVKPMFRNRSWKKDEREEKKRNNKVYWYKVTAGVCALHPLNTTIHTFKELADFQFIRF